MSHQVFEPNQFILHDNDAQIQYSIDSRTGIAHFTYKPQTDQTYHFHDDDINVIGTAIGRLITVTIGFSTNPRSETLLTVLFPTVYLPIGVMEQSIEAELILTQRSLPQQGRRRVEGQVERYEIRSLSGTAQLIEF